MAGRVRTRVAVMPAAAEDGGSTDGGVAARACKVDVAVSTAVAITTAITITREPKSAAERLLEGFIVACRTGLLSLTGSLGLSRLFSHPAHAMQYRGLMQTATHTDTFLQQLELLTVAASCQKRRHVAAQGFGVGPSDGVGGEAVAKSLRVNHGTTCLKNEGQAANGVSS